MHILQTQSLFAWEALDDSPSINTLRQLLAVIPDQALLNSLRQARGHGRNEYPGAGPPNIRDSSDVLWSLYDTGLRRLVWALTWV